MALVLDTDFRSAGVVPAADALARRVPDAGKGQDFADSLARALEEHTSDAPSSSTEVPATAFGLVLPVVEPSPPIGSGDVPGSVPGDAVLTVPAEIASVGPLTSLEPVALVSSPPLIAQAAPLPALSADASVPPPQSVPFFSTVPAAATPELAESGAGFAQKPSATSSGPVQDTSPPLTPPASPRDAGDVIPRTPAAGPQTVLAPHAERGSPGSAPELPAPTNSPPDPAVLTATAPPVTPQPPRAPSASGLRESDPSSGSVPEPPGEAVPAAAPLGQSLSLPGNAVLARTDYKQPVAPPEAAVSRAARTGESSIRRHVLEKTEVRVDRARPDAVLAAIAGVPDTPLMPDAPLDPAPALTAVAAGTSTTSAPLQTPALVAPPAPAMPQPLLIAAPADLVGIVARTAEDGQSDRIVVQLDPPELGRVSIDFKFDAQGLQHVTITSETPEAMRQLRQMHGDLMQALERQGIGSQNMSFQHQQSQSQQSPPDTAPFRQTKLSGDDAAFASAAPDRSADRSLPRQMAGGRLDIKA